MSPLLNLNTPQFAFPFRLVRGEIEEIEQDTEEEIIQNAEIVIRYPKGYRSAMPEFGLFLQELRQGGADLNQIASSVRTWEPAATIEVVRQALTADGLDTIEITLGTDK
jgi:phage baseplate assembly protein W